MCLYSKEVYETKAKAQHAKNNPLVAKKDIIVYKRLIRNSSRDKGYSPFRSMDYQKGYHYYNEGIFRFGVEIRSYGYSLYHLEVDKGLHAYLEKPKHYLNSAFVKMIIPKGSTYYLGNRNDIVTDNLIWY